jgi:hypothetical protein
MKIYAVQKPDTLPARAAGAQTRRGGKGVTPAKRLDEFAAGAADLFINLARGARMVIARLSFYNAGLVGFAFTLMATVGVNFWLEASPKCNQRNAASCAWTTTKTLPSC